jgi:glycosyltransferase involved in cell wall biosynthesis
MASTVAPIRLLAEAGVDRVFFVEDLRRMDGFWQTFLPKDIIYVQLSWHIWEAVWPKLASKVINQGLDPLNFVALASNEYERIGAINAGFSSILCNHNCWLDEKLFTPPENFLDIKKYDLILNTRPEKWKRPYLAQNIDNLAIIKGLLFRPDEYFELKDLNPKFINDHRISPDQVARKIHESWVGGVFSEEEGACYSSSEMLLCGVPVVSTPSRGGRDIWYNENNSIIVNPDSESVREATYSLIELIKTHKIDCQAVREDHIKLSHKFREAFMTDLEHRCSGELVDVIRKQVVDERFFRHKMVEYHKISNLPYYIRHTV